MTEQQPLTEKDLSPLLSETFLCGISWFEETDSTNTRATALLSSDQRVATPHLVYAQSQTSGRGRGSNQWWSAAGSLTFSVVIDCERLGVSVQQQPLLPLITGMALLRAGQSVLPHDDFSVKWPNDVYLSGRKLAGILAEVPTIRKPQGGCSESSDELPAPRNVIIGVGVNVNNCFGQAPEGLRETGISLADQSGSSHDRVEFLRLFLSQLESLLRALADGESVLANWSEFCLLTGKRVTIQTGDTSTTGVCCGIDVSGALSLETSEGTRRFLGGVVKSWG